MLNLRLSGFALAGNWKEEPIIVARDPFAPDTSVAPSPAPRAAGIRIDQSAGTVTAVVTGSSPRALVDDGAHVRVVAVGDKLGKSRIVAIDAAGVHLQDGTLLTLAEDRP